MASRDDGGYSDASDDDLYSSSAEDDDDPNSQSSLEMFSSQISDSEGPGFRPIDRNALRGKWSKSRFDAE
uniref:Uncharacterized protein n=1 Tax=Magallana gigas TaxID=29159 RepID=K1PXG8_MAGGI